MIKARLSILGNWEGKLSPVYTKTISFNGIGEEGHETFSFPRTLPPSQSKFSEEEGVFEFCKTDRKLYDEVVVACLIVIQKHLGKNITIKTDGGGQYFYNPAWHGVGNGFDLIKEVFGEAYLEGVEFPKIPINSVNSSGETQEQVDDRLAKR